MQRTLAGMIASEKKGLTLRIPAGEGETANQVIDHPETPAKPGAGEHLIIGHAGRQAKDWPSLDGERLVAERRSLKGR